MFNWVSWKIELYPAFTEIRTYSIYLDIPHSDILKTGARWARMFLYLAAKSSTDPFIYQFLNVKKVYKATELQVLKSSNVNESDTAWSLLFQIIFDKIRSVGSW